MVLTPEPGSETPGYPYNNYEPQGLASAPVIVTLEPVADTVTDTVSCTVTDKSESPATRQAESIGWSIVKGFLSFLLSIIAYALICAFVALLAARPSNIPELIQGTDVVWIMEEIGLDDIILQQVNDTFINDLSIDIYDIEQFLKRSNVADELGKAADGYIKALTEGNTGYYLSSREIVSFLKAVAPDIRDQFDYKLTDDDFDLIIESLEEQVDLKEFRVEKILQDVNIDITVPGVVFSVYPLIVTGILCALVLFDIFLLHRRRVEKGFLTAGVPVILAGMTYIAAGMLFGFFSNLLSSTALFMITRLAGGIAYMIFIYGLVCFSAGFLFLILYVIIGSIKRKRPAKQASTKGSKAWILTGLVTNVSLLVVCAAISFLFYNNMI